MEGLFFTLAGMARALNPEPLSEGLSLLLMVVVVVAGKIEIETEGDRMDVAAVESEMVLDPPALPSSLDESVWSIVCAVAAAASAAGAS